ncbi:MAG: hypothetical protein IPL08_04785 [Saprospiraceae bacterium]|nr:hypothetical protein [Saprospiraceae bacterium]
MKIANIDLTASGNVAMNNIRLHPGDVIIAPSKNIKTLTSGYLLSSHWLRLLLLLLS